MTPLFTSGDGYWMVPPGKLVNTVVWLEIRRRPVPARSLALHRVTRGEAEACRDLFRTIGTPWLWSRAHDFPMPGGGPADAPVAQDVHFALDDEGRTVGIVEFEGRPGREIEIPWFGLTEGARGRGLGRRMMEAALDLAWQSGPDRVWLHTSSFDHPGAGGFYRACGFEPYRHGFEVMDDPRLLGQLPPDAAPHVPMIGRPS